MGICWYSSIFQLAVQNAEVGVTQNGLASSLKEETTLFIENGTSCCYVG